MFESIDIIEIIELNSREMVDDGGGKYSRLKIKVE